MNLTAFRLHQLEKRGCRMRRQGLQPDVTDVERLEHGVEELLSSCVAVAVAHEDSSQNSFDYVREQLKRPVNAHGFLDRRFYIPSEALFQARIGLAACSELKRADIPGPSA